MMEQATLDPESFTFLRKHVYDGSGIVLDEGKQYLLEARLGPVVREHGLQSLAHLCAILRDGGASPLRRRVLEAMTTNETYFFREPAHYQILRESLLPELLDLRGQTRKLSVWSAAASTGQEAYSIAITLLEMGLDSWNIDILGTDLAERVLERARQGRYSQLEVNRGLPAALLLKYFRRTGLEWELKDEVRRMVRYQPFDLRSSMRAMGPFDVVFCRNVLIYFDLETKKRILREMHGTLFRGGNLVLGTAENAAPMDERYARRTVSGTTVYVAC